jgi:hypothetical protein
VRAPQITGRQREPEFRLVAQTTEWPLSRASEAYAALRAGTVTGRAVIVPDDAAQPAPSTSST